VITFVLTLKGVVMVTVVLMIMEKKFNYNFGDATKYTPTIDFVGAALTAVGSYCWFY
jgi:hypothetical protein